MKRRHVVLVSVVVLAVLGSVRTARANLGVEPPPAGGSMNSGGVATYVQMGSEEVLIIVGDESADVKATFHMLNMGTKEEILDVRFPVGVHMINWDGSEYEDWGVDTDSFTIYVEGYKTNFTVAKSEEDEHIWATWRVAFPPQERVTVEVSYRAVPFYFVPQYPYYTYILETGAGWYGRIGEGTITFRLPYEVSKVTMLENWYSYIAAKYAIRGTDIVWHFTDLEPTYEDNVSILILSPIAWRAWQEAEKEVVENPDSVSAHLRLAYALNSVAYTDYDGPRRPELFDRAMQEYKLWLNVIPDEYVLQVIPNIVDYHLDYIKMLYYSRSDEACAEFLRVSKLDPGNEQLIQMREYYKWCIEGTPYPPVTLYSPPGCEPRAGRCPPPTATPTATPTQTPSPTVTPFIPSPAPSATLAATPTPTPLSTPPPEDSPKIGVWIAVAAAVIGGAWVSVWAYRRKAR